MKKKNKLDYMDTKEIIKYLLNKEPVHVLLHDIALECDKLLHQNIIKNRTYHYIATKLIRNTRDELIYIDGFVMPESNSLINVTD